MMGKYPSSGNKEKKHFGLKRNNMNRVRNYLDTSSYCNSNFLVFDPKGYIQSSK